MLLSDFKRGFFDQAAVVRSMDAATRKAFSKYGAYVRQVAKTSMRKARGASRPGRPPHSHEGSLRNGILFAYDAAAKSVVVGPTLLNGRPRAGKTLPELHEYGGTRQAKKGTARYPARSFMRPAAAKNLPLVSDLLRDKMR